MSSSHELYNRLIQTIQPLVTVLHRQRLANWLWISVGILQANSMALSKIATHIPGEINTESRVTRIRRWLMNFRVDRWTFYRPILEQVLRGWRGVTVYIVLDGVMAFGDRRCCAALPSSAPRGSSVRSSWPMAAFAMAIGRNCARDCTGIM